jgi:tRNA dimethylallyltransferase
METTALRPIFLAGPTASGKSAIAMDLATRLSGEIISVDSMQVYRGLDIGTAKPSAEDRDLVRHHLIDVAELNQGFDAAQFIQLANDAVNDIQSRGRVPIFCGGTGFYFKAFLEGLGEAPPSDPRIRAQLTGLSLEELLEELARTDPAAFASIDKKNLRRVMRALEVIRLTGRPFSEQRANWGKTAQPDSRMIGITRPAGELVERVHWRVDGMFRNGLVAETQSLLQRGLEQNTTAMQALGYRQVVEHLHGQRGLAETIELVKIRTRQFAKRQLTWFRRQMRLEWITVTGESVPDVVSLFSCSETDTAARNPNEGRSKFD